MRFLTFLVLTNSAAAAASVAVAQQPERSRVRPTAESRASTEARTAQYRDSIILRGLGLGAEIERLAEQLMTNARQQALATRAIRELTTRRVQDADRQQIEVTVRRLQSQLQNASRETQLLRGRLAELCDRGAKPEGYMGITFSATMRAEALASGAEVFRFAENPKVETVEPGSPAERAGVAKGDEIVLIAGENVVGRDIVFTRLLRPGNRLALRVRREGETRDMLLLISERPPSLDNGCPFLDARVMAAFGEPFTPVIPPAVRAFVRGVPLPPTATEPSGVVRLRTPRPAQAPVAITTEGPPVEATPNSPMVPSVTLIAPNADAPIERSVFVVGPAVNQMVIAGATIVRPNADLRETFGVKRGVLVLDGARGTPAYKSGLKGGDIILSAGRFTATTPSSVQRAMLAADDRSVELHIIRKQKAHTIHLRW